MAMISPVHVHLITRLGTIKLCLRLDCAPRSTSAFLARILDGSFTGKATFYRSVRGCENDRVSPAISVLQGGLLHPPPLAGVQHEPTTVTGLRHGRGTVSLARGALGTATGAGFFICLEDTPALDAGGGRDPFHDGAGFAAFGQVVAGMAVVTRIHGGALAKSNAQRGLSGQVLDPEIAFVAEVASPRGQHGFLSKELQ